MLWQLDAFLLRKAQQLCDANQRWTGQTKFVLQKWALLLSIAFCVAGALCWSDFLAVILILIYVVGTVPLIKLGEREEADFLANGELKFCPFHVPHVRVVCLGLNVWIAASLVLISPGTDNWLFAGMYASLCAFIYIIACVPKPPSKSKFRQLYENGLWRLNDWLKPAPAFVPIPVENR